MTFDRRGLLQRQNQQGEGLRPSLECLDLLARSRLQAILPDFRRLLEKDLPNPQGFRSVAVRHWADPGRGKAIDFEGKRLMRGPCEKVGGMMQNQERWD